MFCDILKAGQRPKLLIFYKDSFTAPLNISPIKLFMSHFQPLFFQRNFLLLHKRIPFTKQRRLNFSPPILILMFKNLLLISLTHKRQLKPLLMSFNIQRTLFQLSTYKFILIAPFISKIIQ